MTHYVFFAVTLKTYKSYRDNPLIMLQLEKLKDLKGLFIPRSFLAFCQDCFDAYSLENVKSEVSDLYIHYIGCAH